MLPLNEGIVGRASPKTASLVKQKKSLIQFYYISARAYKTASRYSILICCEIGKDEAEISCVKQARSIYVASTKMFCFCQS